MVVALLGMLFVVGVAFLQTVTFEARQIDSEVEAQQIEAAIDAIEAKVFQALTDQWLSPGGAPYQMDGPDFVKCVSEDSDGNCEDLDSSGDIDPDEVTRSLRLPAYGELPYVHGLLAPSEPYMANFETPRTLVLPFAGDVESALNRQIATLREFLYEPDDPLDPDEPRHRRARINLEAVGDFAVDADGDGIPDSREFDITGQNGPIVLPPDARETLLEHLNHPDATADGAFLSVRAIPHGGMVDVNWSHHELVYALFPEAAGTPGAHGWLRKAWGDDGSGRPYAPHQPGIEEAALRHRGGLPPRQLSESALQRSFEPALLGPLCVDPKKPDNRGAFNEHRWWFHDTTETGEDEDSLFWLDIMAPPDGTSPSFDEYDRRHLLTTYSTDNLIMRDGTFHDPGRYGRGWIEMIRADNADGRDDWALDEYPYVPAAAGGFEPLSEGDPHKGRIQISLPYLEISLLDDPGLGADNGVNSLQTRLTSLDDTIRTNAEKFVRTIQDGFLLMLRNVPDEKDPTPVLQTDEKERIAASLTANLIDFADSDDVPTEIEILDTNGLSYPTKEFVYGLERQPFITEVYNRAVYGPDWGDGKGALVPPQSFSAIELYNPYGNLDANPPVLEPIDLSSFSLKIDDNDEIELSGMLETWSYRVFVTNMPSIDPPPNAEELPGMPQLTQSSQVRLWREHPASSQVVVDHFDIPKWQEDFPNMDSNGPASASKEESIERAMWRVDLDTPGGGITYWTVVVPVANARPDKPDKHTLGGVNWWKGHDPDTTVKQIVRPVHVDFANSPNGLQDAFPTTGTLLLLMRHANSPTEPFNSYLAETPDGGEEWKAEQYQIDNGRMPVFDVAGKHRLKQNLNGKEMTAKLPMGHQFLPWGQYVFDYFTALPLDNAFAYDGDRNTTPEVDLIGARVYGRININAAPWTVQAGLPLGKLRWLPGSYKYVIQRFTYLGETDKNIEIPIGELDPSDAEYGELAKAIVAYRDTRRIPGAPGSDDGESGDFTGRSPLSAADLDLPVPQDRFPPKDSGPGGIDHALGFGELRKGSGFLTVGELANVRHWSLDLEDAIDGDYPNNKYSLWRIDGGVIGRKHTVSPDDYPVDLTQYPAEDYVQAVGLLVALGDWVTTRSNVWTIYGTVRGYRGEDNEFRAEVEKRAIRFEETVDRLPSFLNPGSPPRRIGERRVGPYNNTRAD